MTLLNEADDIYLGSVQADRVFLGIAQVWPYQSFHWELIGSWTYSVDVPNVVFTNLDDYTEIRILLRNTKVSITGSRRVRVSFNNGVSYLSTSGDYMTVDLAGNMVPATHALITYTPTLGNLMTGEVLISGWNLTAPKLVQNTTLTNIRAAYIPTPNKLNALQISDSGGGNLTGGSLWVWGR